MLLLLDLTNIAQKNTKLHGRTYLPRKYLQNILFFQNFQNTFFLILGAFFRGPRGSSPPFSNSPPPATYPLIFPHHSTPFLSPSYSSTPDVSTYFRISFFTVVYSFFNFSRKSMLRWKGYHTTIYLSIYLSICLSVSLSVCLSVYLSCCYMFSTCTRKNTLPEKIRRYGSVGKVLYSEGNCIPLLYKTAT